MTVLYQNGQTEVEEIKKKEARRSSGNAVKYIKDKELHRIGIEEAYKEQAKQILMDKKKVGRAEAQREAYKEAQKQKILDQGKIDALMKQTNRTLYKISTVFPFTFFPTTLIIAEDKIDILNKLFFLSTQTISLRSEDIKVVEVTTSWFFATLRFDVQWTELPHPDPITFLKKSEAMKAKNIIDGLIAMRKAEINIANFSKDEIVEKSQEIGSSNETLR